MKWGVWNEKKMGLMDRKIGLEDWLVLVISMCLAVNLYILLSYTGMETANIDAMSYQEMADKLVAYWQGKVEAIVFISPISRFGFFPSIIPAVIDYLFKTGSEQAYLILNASCLFINLLVFLVNILSVLAKTFQSIFLVDSPSLYNRCSANSTEKP